MLQKLSYRKILFSDSHLEAPFTFRVETAEGTIKKQKVSRKLKITAIAAAVLLALPTLGIGSIASIYLIGAAAKYRAQKKGACKDCYKITTASFKFFTPKKLLSEQTHFDHIAPVRIPAVLRDVPASSVGVKIPNIGNTCWLNSMLKMLAANTYFDPMLAISDNEIRAIVCREHSIASLDESPEARSKYERLVNLRDHLKFIVNGLRTPTNGAKATLNPAYVASLVELLHSLDKTFNYQQNDTAEGLTRLAQFFDFFSRGRDNFPEQTTIYDSLSKGQTKTASADRFILVTKHASAFNLQDKNSKIDLNLSVNEFDGEILTVSDDADVRGEFIQRKILTNAPDQLVVQINRQRYDSDSTIGNAIDMDDNLRIKIKTYAPGEKGRFSESAELAYEVAGAVLHRGGSKGGHYTFVEKSGARFIHHDDDDLREIDARTAKYFFEHASIVILKKVATTPIGMRPGTPGPQPQSNGSAAAA